MASPNFSAALRTSRVASEPSPALLALQQKGLELPLHRNTSTPIPPQSNTAYDPRLQVSPLSILSTPSNLWPSPLQNSEPEEIEFAWRRRTSNTASVETTVTGILNLYTNLSKQSFKSEYEEITPYPDSDDASDEDAPPLPTVHQPKAQAYRDTIAPLLDHQFSDSTLMVPGVISPGLSPMSLASMPVLMHPNASLSVPSLRLTPDGSSHHGAQSDTSIQITPEMSPITVPAPIPASSQNKRSNPDDQKIVLEVPDVREADSWYDQPLSPISPEDLEYRNAIRDSQQSAVSPQSPATQQNHFRSLAFESLSPPSMNIKTSPGLRSVKVVEGDSDMIPLPLDLTRSRTLISRGSTPAHQTEIVRQLENEQGGARSQHPSLMFAGDSKTDFVDGSLRIASKPLEQRMSYVTVESDTGTQHLNIEEIERPCSAFSDSSDSYVIHDTIGGQVKAMWKEKFGKKKEKEKKRRSKGDEQRRESKSGSGRNKGKKKAKEERIKSGPTMTRNVTTAFTDETESYRYPYRLTQSSTSGVPEKHNVESNWDTPATYGHDERPSVGDVPRPALQPDEMPAIDSDVDREYPAIPLTRYQKYGEQIWYESNKKKRAKERERLRKETEKIEKQQAKEGQAVESVPIPESIGALYTQQNPKIQTQTQTHNHPYPHLQATSPSPPPLPIHPQVQASTAISTTPPNTPTPTPQAPTPPPPQPPTKLVPPAQPPAPPNVTAPVNQQGHQTITTPSLKRVAVRRNGVVLEL